ncbi:hypothetical protein HanRHA438_Chr04g0194191 [Helianthus annuus]|nr:hypothetical protein HanRHA438_Chr04g0194191 [Helianthus annuus]
MTRLFTIWTRKTTFPCMKAFAILTLRKCFRPFKVVIPGVPLSFFPLSFWCGRFSLPQNHLGSHDGASLNSFCKSLGGFGFDKHPHFRG